MKYIFVLISVLLTGCGGDSNPSEEGDTENKSIVGTWISHCYLAYDDPEIIYSVAEFHITDTTISNIYTHYSDANCMHPYSGSQNLWGGYDGTYTLLSTVTTTSGVDADWLEITYNTDPPEDTDVVIESGLYVNNDELSLVIEDGGFYYIVLSPKYYKE